ncbi:hypothetical protein ACFOEK_12245 [Litoribrevibacter euphylliae]|uniref:Uncharacterized protein n=1 Tax=Litoribrevibacter euphylliae TaxID=1834034 RepID=A0ABV7HGD9_9GAMM
MAQATLFTDKQLIGLGVAAAVVGGLVIWQASKAAKAAAEFTEEVITEDLNPVSDQNLAYSGVNGVGAALTGDEDFKLGRWLYEKLN